MLQTKLYYRLLLLSAPLLIGCGLLRREAHCPTDARRLYVGVGEEAVRVCPCGPDCAFHGHKPTHWRRWDPGWWQYRSDACGLDAAESLVTRGSPCQLSPRRLAPGPFGRSPGEAGSGSSLELLPVPANGAAGEDVQGDVGASADKRKTLEAIREQPVAADPPSSAGAGRVGPGPQHAPQESAPEETFDVGGAVVVNDTAIQGSESNDGGGAPGRSGAFSEPEARGLVESRLPPIEDPIEDLSAEPVTVEVIEIQATGARDAELPQSEAKVLRLITTEPVEKPENGPKRGPRDQAVAELAARVSGVDRQRVAAANQDSPVDEKMASSEVALTPADLAPADRNEPPVVEVSVPRLGKPIAERRAVEDVQAPSGSEIRLFDLTSARQQDSGSKPVIRLMFLKEMGPVAEGGG